MSDPLFKYTILQGERVVETGYLNNCDRFRAENKAAERASFYPGMVTYYVELRA